MCLITIMQYTNELNYLYSYFILTESECKWTGLFQECTTKPEIIDQWENFTRILCSKYEFAFRVLVILPRMQFQTYAVQLMSI